MMTAMPMTARVEKMSDPAKPNTPFEYGVDPTLFPAMTFDEVYEKVVHEYSGHDVLILSHINPDGDTLGSSFALRELIFAAGGRAYVCCADEIPRYLRFLSFPQDSILPESIPDNFLCDRIISVDVASPSRLGGLWNIYGGENGRIDMMIDHHGKGTPFASHYIEEHSAAVGEIIYAIYERFCQNNTVSENAARNILNFLYTAISSDTGCFKYSNVTPRTHMIASKLVGAGIDFAEINRLLFDVMSPDRLRLQRAVLNNIQTYFGGKAALAAFPIEMIHKIAVPYDEYSHAIDIVRSIEGVSVAVVIRQPSNENVFHVSMRSTGDIDVAEICAAFGGGGHARAAGITFACDSIEQAQQLLLDKIGEFIA